jgi:hypothetical protein
VARDDGRWWWTAFGATMVILAAPFLFVDVPPVLDYPNHLARLVVLAFPDDPAIRQMYAAHWAVLPNLALDIIGPPLLAILPVHVAGRVLLALAAALPVVGVVAYHRAVTGQRSLWPLASAVVAFNGVFFLGFINFLYGIGLALIAAACWIGLIERRPLAALSAGLVAGVVLFFCHPLAILLFLLLVASHEIVGWWRRRSLRRAVTRGGILIALAVVPAALTLLSPFAGGGAGIAFDFAHKPVDFLSPFLTYHQPLTTLTAVAVLSAFALLWRRSTIDPGSLLALIVLAAAFVLSPSAFGGGTFIAPRLPVMMALVAFGMLRPTLPVGAARVLFVAVAALIVARTADVAWVWYGHRQDIGDVRAAIAPVGPGARVLVVSTTAGSAACGPGEPSARCIPGLYRTDGHVAALLLIERRAFWPLLFADPRQQPVRINPPYDAIARPLGEPPSYLRLANGGEAGPDAPYLENWAGKFDYVLLVNADSAGKELSVVAPGQLDLVERAGFAALYRVRRSG